MSWLALFRLFYSLILRFSFFFFFLYISLFLWTSYVFFLLFSLISDSFCFCSVTLGFLVLYLILAFLLSCMSNPTFPVILLHLTLVFLFFFFSYVWTSFYWFCWMSEYFTSHICFFASWFSCLCDPGYAGSLVCLVLVFLVSYVWLLLG